LVENVTPIQIWGFFGSGTLFAIPGGITQSQMLNYEDGYRELDESVGVWMRGDFVYLL
jgi:hypothetical protein